MSTADLFELKVIVEADGWRDVAALMAAVDRALDPHQAAQSRERRWSVIADRLSDERAGELRALIDELDAGASAGVAGGCHA